MRYLFAAVAAAALLHAVPSRAAESYNACQFEITSVPAVLTSPGVWCMKKDFGTSLASGAAITVATNNVTIDCNGFRVSGLGAGLGTGNNGIVSSGRINTVIRNCHLRGFQIGIKLDGTGSYGHIVEDNRIEASTLIGIYAYSDGTTLRRNLISDTGGATGGVGFAFGIDGDGEVDILDNTIWRVEPAHAGSGSMAIGIRQYNGGTSTVADNRVKELIATGNGAAYGIQLGGGGGIVADHNMIQGAIGLSEYGIVCSDSSMLATRNDITGYNSDINGCTQFDNASVLPDA